MNGVAHWVGVAAAVLMSVALMVALANCPHEHTYREKLTYYQAVGLWCVWVVGGLFALFSLTHLSGGGG